MQYNCLIVDDETGAHAVLKNYIERLKYLQLVGEAYDAVEASIILQEQKIDLVFLDVNMPEISGLDFIKTLQNPPKIILTTAYSEFALEAYDLGVVDYLVKPIPFNRFLKCLHKVIPEMLDSIQIDTLATTSKPLLTSLRVKVDGVMMQIAYDDILYFQALGNYVKIVTAVKKHLTISTMQELEKMIDSRIFVRVHKSYIVPIKHVFEQKNPQKVIIANNEIPIGRSYKLAVQKLFV
jgi:DNA-binding LytR/AlgR family response regulator